MRVFVQDQGMRKNNHRHIADIPRIFFEHTADIEQKDHFWMDTI